MKYGKRLFGCWIFPKNSNSQLTMMNLGNTPEIDRGSQILVSIEVSDNPIPLLRSFELNENPYTVDDFIEELPAIVHTEPIRYSENGITRLITCKKSNGVFGVTANCFQARDQRPDLNLVTIKYLENSRQSAQTPNHSFINEVGLELQQIKRFVSDLYYNVGMKPRTSNITVQEWCENKNKENRQRRLLLRKTESAERNWHARIKIVDGESGPSIVKHFDVSASNLDLKQIIAMHLEYRKNMAIVYSVPRLEKIQKLGTSEFETTEPFVVGKSGQEIITHGSFPEICRFLSGVMLPLAKTIEVSRKLPGGIESPFPVKYPVDWKPENFIETKDGDMYIVDLFPSMLRSNDGTVITLYPLTDSPVRFAINYGEFHVLTARMLLRSVRIRPDLAIEITNFTKNLIGEIDKSGKMLQLLRIFANSKEKIKIYGSKPGGMETLKELARKT